MIDLAWKSTLILAVAWATALALRNRSAALRHIVWTTAFGLLLLLPLLTLALPRLTVPREAPLGALLATVTSVPTAPATPKAASPIATPTTVPSQPIPDLQTALKWLWATGTVYCLLRILIACFAILNLRRHTSQLPANEAKEIADQLGVRGPIEVLAIPAGEMPSSFGNSVFLPLDAAQWSPERRQAVLLHELTHVRRGDTTLQILARMAWSVYWWNPLAWLAWRALVDERESAVDDVVLQSGMGAADYASYLMELARSVRPAARMAPVLVAMATQSKLETRIMAILDSTRDRCVPGKYVTLGVMAAALAVLVPIAALRAQEPAGLPADLDVLIRAGNATALETMAQRAAGLAEYETGKTLMKAALVARSKESGELSKEYGRSLLKLAYLEWHTRSAAALQSYMQAAVLLQNQPEAAQALIPLAVMEMERKDLDAALRLLDRAVTADPKAAARAAMWRAIIRERQGRTVDADLLYRNAMEAADPKSDDAANIMELHARLLSSQSNPVEAQELGARAQAIRRTQNPPPVSGSEPRAGVHRIANGIQPPSVVSKVEPQYSPEASAAKYQGSVTLYVEVTADGQTGDVRVLRGLGLGLNENAIAAVRKWKFRPAKKDDEPVTVAATIEVNFRLL
jgi:TonB family protein